MPFCVCENEFEARKNRGLEAGDASSIMSAPVSLVFYERAWLRVSLAYG